MGQPANPGVPYVAPDPQAAAEIIDHVVGLGHRKIDLLSLTRAVSADTVNADHMDEGRAHPEGTARW